MNKIGFISPYFELELIAKKENIKVKTADGYQAISVANKMIEEGVEIIISRGGTALVLKENLNIPVVEMQTTELEIMKSVKKAKSISKRIGYCGYKNIVYNMDSIQDILDVELYSVIINKHESKTKMRNKIKKLIGIVDVVVGDNLSVQVAREFGMEGILIESGENSVLSSINEANKMREAIRLERTRFNELMIILNNIHDGIMSLDIQGIVKYFNPTAEKVFNIKNEDIIGRRIQDILPEINLEDVIFNKKEKKDEIYTIKGKTIIFSNFPIDFKKEITGSVIVFRDITDVQSQEEKIRKKVYFKGHVAKYSFDNMITNDEKIEKIVDLAKLYGKTNSNILITGETGTGKEYFAQSIHNASKRCGKPFVALNCAALPDTLLESELFGYEDGSFTGAKKGGKQGLFELAHGGTIFLDEIGEIATHIQTKLLRVLQERQVMRVGGFKIIPVDVRVIAATNIDLKKAINEKKFRKDLYYRLNVLKINIMPLRERRGSIVALINFFMEKHCSLNKTEVKIISKDAMALLQSYNWPGNIRELENIVERISIVAQGKKVSIDDMKNILDDLDNQSLDEEGADKTNCNSPYEMKININRNLKQIEEEIVKKALEACDFNKTKAANMLGIGRVTLWRWANLGEENI